MCGAILFTTGVRIIVKIFPYYEMYVNGENPAQMFASDGKGRIIILYLILFIVLTAVSLLVQKIQNWAEWKHTILDAPFVW